MFCPCVSLCVCLLSLTTTKKSERQRILCRMFVARALALLWLSLVVFGAILIHHLNWFSSHCDFYDFFSFFPCIHTFSILIFFLLSFWFGKLNFMWFSSTWYQTRALSYSFSFPFYFSISNFFSWILNVGVSLWCFFFLIWFPNDSLNVCLAVVVVVLYSISLLLLFIYFHAFLCSVRVLFHFIKINLCNVCSR